MAGSDIDTVNRETFQIAYDGPGGAGGRNAHEMDVQSIGPALVAFGRLIKEANTQLNGKKSTVKVLVQSNFEHKCFNVTLDVVQSVLHQLSTFLTGDEIKDAKQILSDLGIIFGPAGLGLLGYLKWKGQQAVSEVRDADERGIVIIQLGNGNTTNISRDVYNLSKSYKIRSAVEGTLKPLGTDGIETIKFQGPENSAVYDRNDATTIVASFDIADEATAAVPEDDDEGVIAWLRVYSPVYDEKAPKWRFLYDGKIISVNITETSISADALNRGGALVNDLYKVRMNIHPHLTPSGEERFDYTVVEVIDFTQATPQPSLPFDGRRT